MWPRDVTSRGVCNWILKKYPESLTYVREVDPSYQDDSLIPVIQLYDSLIPVIQLLLER